MFRVQKQVTRRILRVKLSKQGYGFWQFLMMYVHTLFVY